MYLITECNHKLMNAESCFTCRYFQERPLTAPGVGTGKCLRYPPIFISTTESRFPVVTPETWCGDWVVNAQLVGKTIAEIQKELDSRLPKPQIEPELPIASPPESEPSSLPTAEEIKAAYEGKTVKSQIKAAKQ